MSKLNIKPRTIFCHDNLPVLEGVNSGCIDLIYLDPPFNKNKTFTAPIGSSAEGAEFSDIFKEEDVKDEWVKSIEFENPELHSYLLGVKTFSNNYNYCYLVYMAIRLIECRRILKDTGSLYLHCDPTMSHYLKIVMDCIFGEGNFLNEIIWHYGKWSNTARYFQRNHDVILFYTKGGKHTFNPLYALRAKEKPYGTNHTDSGWQLLVYDKEKTPASVIKKYKAKGYRIVHVAKKGVMEHDTWTYARDKNFNILNSQSKERTGYPTQKPLALLEQVIAASSNKGDVVLDPFCGCATTCIAAEKLERKWIGVDVSQKAYELVKLRLDKDVLRLIDEEPHFSTTPPKRGKDEQREQGYVYVIANTNWPGIYKVGIAKDPKRRLNSYQTSDPFRAYTLEFQQKTPHFREIEAAIHRQFNADNEWVKADLKTIKAAIRKAMRK